jgi:hypothetical protein
VRQQHPQGGDDFFLARRDAALIITVFDCTQGNDPVASET